jgi:preprotein translocase subunit YajC
MLDLLMGVAYAQDATAQAAAPGWSVMLFSYLPIVFIFVIFYLLIIKPQQEASKAHAKLVKELKRADVVLIEGGLIGEVTKVAEEKLHLRVNAEDEVCVARASVKKVLNAEEAKGWEPAALEVRRKK